MLSSGKSFAACKKSQKNVHYIMICQSEHFNHTLVIVLGRTVLERGFLLKLAA